jgi:cytochrome c553
VPDFGPTQTLSHAPPAVSGGTLLVTRNGARAVAADPDRDQVYIVDLSKPALVATIQLLAGDEPGRLVEDDGGRVHVALRHGGAVVSLDLATHSVVDRRHVCSAPRGLAYDPARKNLVVACNGGELVTLPVAGGPPTRTLFLDPDLRDVVVGSGHVFVSRFRQAEVLEIDDDGAVAGIGRPPTSSSGMEPDVAWRMISAPLPAGVSGVDPIAVVHQLARPTPVSTDQGGYGQSSGCPETSIIEASVTTFGGLTPDGAGPVVPAAVLPVDIALSPEGSTFAIVAAGNSKLPQLPSVFFLPRGAHGTVVHDGAGCAEEVTRVPVAGQATSIAFSSSDTAWVQTREPATLVEVTQSAHALHVTATVPLSSESREDTGHSIVHSNTGAFISCASCHAEGGEDGRTWQFTTKGKTTPLRRTQSLRGTLADTAPYHWEGDLRDIPSLAHEVFVKRMSGPSLSDDQSAALEKWLFAVPRPPTSPPRSAASAARGAKLFEQKDVGCRTCHLGERFTNNLTLDVGTGGRFQVPSLVGVGWRAPYLHDGRAPQLVDRFNPSLGGDLHGHTSQLDTGEIDDLVSYLQTL